MRVVLLTGEYPPMQGGVGDFTREIAKGLAALGVDVRVVTSQQSAVSSQPPAASGQPSAIGNSQLAIRNSQFAIRNSQFAICNSQFVPHWGWRTLPRLRNLTRDADVVNIQYQAAAYGMSPAIHLLPWYLRRQSTRPKIVTTFHDLKVPYLFPKAGPLRWQAILALARYSDTTIVTNPEDHQRLSPYPFIRSLSVVPIGSNIAPTPPPDYDRDAWRARLGFAPDECVLCYFGFLNASKGGETLVCSLDNLRRRGYNVRLFMVGGQTGSSDPTNVAFLERVRGLIAALGLTQYVLWSGYTPAEQVSANLLASDVCILPYRDGASFRRGSFMAALAHGLPIVSTTPRVALAELVDGENVALVPPDDPTALADAIAQLIESPERCARLSRGARQLAQQFEWPGIAAKTLGLFRTLT